MKNNKLSPLIVIIAVGIIFVIILSNNIFKTLEPGEKGVIFRKFTSGLAKDEIFNAGFHIIAPWNTLYVYDVREQKVEEEMEVLDKNGLTVRVEISVRFNPIHERIGYLHEKFGNDYITRLVAPEVRSSVRSVMGRYTAEEIYATKRQEVEAKIISETKAILGSEVNNIDMRALLIRSIILPEKIKAAIESKLQQEQEALAYQFRLESEKSEAERKRIAAEGEARANAIINSSLTPALLKMRGIEATIELSKSQNSKTVIIGSGSDGLPLILGNN